MITDRRLDPASQEIGQWSHNGGRHGKVSLTCALRAKMASFIRRVNCIYSHKIDLDRDFPLLFKINENMHKQAAD